MRCSEDSVQRASVRAFDPLPIYYDPFGTPTIRRSAAVAWKHRNTLPAHAYHALREAGMLAAQRKEDGSPGPSARALRSRAVQSPKLPGISARKSSALR
jgi:hypothetical protein